MQKRTKNKPSKSTKKVKAVLHTDPTKPPKVGDDIYLPTALYLSHGADDFEGGLCKVVEVTMSTSAGKQEPFIECAERPGHRYNWRYLAPEQEEYQKEFGNRRGYPDPDMHPDANRWD